MHDDTAAPDRLDLAGGGAGSTPVHEPLVTVPQSERHRVADFQCSNSKRVTEFFRNEALILVPQNYCRVFILPSPNDPTEVWGYYTLSAALLEKDKLTNGDEKRASKKRLSIPVPMVRIGFMGRHDTADKGLGSFLLIDAARRVHRNPDIAAWGLVLESEGGETNAKLWEWYQKQGFKPCRIQSASMYAPLTSFIPELTQAG